jgi:hypothetical protein
VLLTAPEAGDTAAAKLGLAHAIEEPQLQDVLSRLELTKVSVRGNAHEVDSATP